MINFNQLGQMVSIMVMLLHLKGHWTMFLNFLFSFTSFITLEVIDNLKI